jgi:uncharacterized alkaline shock family protein YloU
MSIVTISPDVVRDVVRITTLATPGVVSLVDQESSWSRSKFRGVDVKMDGEHAHVALHLVAATGVSILELSDSLKTRIREAVDEIANVRIASVDVTVEDVRALS